MNVYDVWTIGDPTTTKAQVIAKSHTAAKRLYREAFWANYRDIRLRLQEKYAPYDRQGIFTKRG